MSLSHAEVPPALPPKPTPLNTDALYALLTPASSKWFEIGLAMGFSSDVLDDDIYPGNSTDWLRLGELCGLYCQSKHSWEEVVRVMWTVEEWEIADSICRQERLEGGITLLLFLAQLLFIYSLYSLMINFLRII